MALTPSFTLTSGDSVRVSPFLDLLPQLAPFPSVCLSSRSGRPVFLYRLSVTHCFLICLESKDSKSNLKNTCDLAMCVITSYLRVAVGLSTCDRLYSPPSLHGRRQLTRVWSRITNLKSTWLFHHAKEKVRCRKPNSP